MNSGAYSSYGQYQTSSYAAGGYPPQPYGAYPTPTPPVAYGAYGVQPVAVGVTPVAVGITTVADVPYTLHIKGSRLDRKDVFSKSDPFVTISVPRNPLYVGKKSVSYSGKAKGGSTAQWAVVHRTETIRDNQNPVWQPFTIGLHTLCGGNLERPIKIECWDYDNGGAHDLIGKSVTSLREMQVMKEIRLVNKKRIGIGKTAGTIEVLKCSP
ncbi:hypothetical protein DICPUDRAFT_72456 [Dictyostelium purpureum]|uniref:C2 domain-containing protein n=1 Tax=Dictyostelium purpureum TaxID=5786 RepID=F0ZLL0_DICPU|nr:uncharacterized protein DICPUDRAFT_72456 [Dictyostelium purpureum]EGC35159.1 hypothetical protein DICPUDRAFT_72456 [Dictyostelium purpureum]|eukprot:XP_003288297.1 hypothetical protein DICPUDRAFT_72456 [Dictyostelium purpureum]